jgi:hypothetical protein
MLLLTLLAEDMAEVEEKRHPVGCCEDCQESIYMDEVGVTVTIQQHRNFADSYNHNACDKSSKDGPNGCVKFNFYFCPKGESPKKRLTCLQEQATRWKLGTLKPFLHTQTQCCVCMYQPDGGSKYTSRLWATIRKNRPSPTDSPEEANTKKKKVDEASALYKAHKVRQRAAGEDVSDDD